MNRIDGKVAVVTGGTQGVGAAIARLFAKAGAAGIVIVGRDVAKGRRAADGITAENDVQVAVVGADLGVMEDVRRVMAEADARFGRVDILVNAAGMSDRGNLLNTSPELFDTLFAVNVRAPVFLMQDAVKIMMREGTAGVIVNIGSSSERAGQPFITAYCASKGALATLTRNAGFALMRNRIRVNQPDIGWTNSDNERRLQAEESGDPDFIDKAAGHAAIRAAAGARRGRARRALGGFQRQRHDDRLGHPVRPVGLGRIRRPGTGTGGTADPIARSTPFRGLMPPS